MLLGFFIVANGVTEGSIFVVLIVVSVRVSCQIRQVIDSIVVSTMFSMSLFLALIDITRIQY